MSAQTLTRANANVNVHTKLSFIYAVNAVRTDVAEIDRVEIFDRDPVREDFAVPPIQVIPAQDVFHPAQGVYEYIAAPVQHGNKFFYDVVYFKPSAGDALKRDLGQFWMSGNVVTTQEPLDWINRLRVALHDDQPDTDYQFAPPAAPQSQFGMKSNTRFLWRDSQLDLALQLGESRINQVFPVTSWPTGFIAAQVPHYWLALSTLEALRMKAILQIAEEFNYSVGSLSLEINRFDKYQGMIEAMEASIMDKETGLPAAKKSLTVHSRTSLAIARNQFPSGVSNFSLSQGFPSGSSSRTLFT